MYLNYANIALGFLVICSLGLNAYLIVKLKSARKSRPESLELSEFMHDLMANKSAMIRVQRVDQSNLFLKSPRDL